MRSQRVIIKIENPCDKPWSEMTLNEQGKFCDHCAKTVVDFTNYSKSELAEKFSSNSETMCGRFRKEQLNKVLVPDKPQTSFSPMKYLAGMFLLTASKNVSASNTLSVTKSTYINTFEDQDKINRDSIPKDSLQNVIEGVVSDSISGEAYPWITVEINELHLRALTDMDGKFKLVIPDSVDIQYVYISA